MRGLVITFIIMVGSFTACSSIFKDAAKNSLSTNYSTDKIRYERGGGGNLDFTISDSDENLIVNITRLEFRDVNLHLIINK